MKEYCDIYFYNVFPVFYFTQYVGGSLVCYPSCRESLEVH